MYESLSLALDPLLVVLILGTKSVSATSIVLLDVLRSVSYFTKPTVRMFFDFGVSGYHLGSGLITRLVKKH